MSDTEKLKIFDEEFDDDCKCSEMEIRTSFCPICEMITTFCACRPYGSCLCS